MDIAEHDDTSPLETFSLTAERDLQRVSFFTGHRIHFRGAQGAPNLLKSMFDEACRFRFGPGRGVPSIIYEAIGNASSLVDTHLETVEV